jgi:hypothetical protein
VDKDCRLSIYSCSWRISARLLVSLAMWLPPANCQLSCSPAHVMFLLLTPIRAPMSDSIQCQPFELTTPS